MVTRVCDRCGFFVDAMDIQEPLPSGDDQSAAAAAAPIGPLTQALTQLELTPNAEFFGHGPNAHALRLQWCIHRAQQKGALVQDELDRLYADEAAAAEAAEAAAAATAEAAAAALVAPNPWAAAAAAGNAPAVNNADALDGNLSYFSLTQGMEPVEASVPDDALHKLAAWLAPQSTRYVVSIEMGDINFHQHLQGAIQVPQGTVGKNFRRDMKRAMGLPDKAKLCLKLFRKGQVWSAMVGYCMKQRDEACFQTIAKNVTDAEIEQGIEVGGW